MAVRMTRWVCLGLAMCVALTMFVGCAASGTRKLSNLAATQQHADKVYADRDWAAAANAYTVLVQDIPENAAYWFRLGNAYAHMNQLELAVRAYRAALQRDPHIAPAWHNLGSVLLKQSQAAFQEAAATASHPDPLQRSSALLAERIGVLRKGDMAAPSDHAAPASATSAPVSAISGSTIPPGSADQEVGGKP